jgi:hypothetical protein
MSVELASEIWTEVKRYVNSVDRNEAAETVVSILIDNDVDAEEIKTAFKGDAMWDILHGKKPTDESLELARRVEIYTEIANRLSAGLRRGEFPQTTEAQKVYRWIAEREAAGEGLDEFLTWAMDGKRAEFSFVYHKDPTLIKRDWPQVERVARSAPNKADHDGGHRL